MSQLTEREIVDCLRQNLREAASKCDQIANNPESGAAYARLRQCLKLAEGACRQLGHFREDARWFVPGMRLEEIHQRACTWLKRPSVASKKLFTKLGELCRAWERDLKRVETMATLSRGAILPKPGRSHRDVRAVQVPAGFNVRPSGLVMPA